jgi:hypothetical protein
MMGLVGVGREVSNEQQPWLVMHMSCNILLVSGLVLNTVRDTAGRPTHLR